MNQLRTALEGGTPSDALVDELARKQNNLSDRLAQQTNDAAALAELQKLQREIADKLGGLNDPDGAAEIELREDNRRVCGQAVSEGRRRRRASQESEGRREGPG